MPMRSVEDGMVARCSGFLGVFVVNPVVLKKFTLVVNVSDEG